METKHTKGTWEVKCLDLKSPNSIPSKPILISSQQGLVATVSRLNKIGGVSVSSGQGEANAELIAAAPETAAERDRLKAVNAELLEAVLTVRKRLVRVCAAGDGMQAFLDAGGLRELAAAITKAEGK